MFKHYTINQVVLPLDLEIKLEKNDIAFVVNNLVESIPEETFKDFCARYRMSRLSANDVKNYSVRIYTVCIFWTENQRGIER